ncbi:hypothetical protein AMET1_1287 [Methanonatronarchaeum thermophilum]|uniref:Uncharacterized protein n=1 Tax=Methanonatronarchaeum thermophilum TaxID=1927129 RepID=A0A1Y3GAA4_9EURY|nr:hypothetical protein [Methanonatronarchaeum thermophilum]OUJ18372.1 hypothetical protein AMET1_1287 [Methanonatronarchaeum thermophilum]
MDKKEIKNKINKICRSNDGIKIMKKPENIEEEVLNAILSHGDKETEELTEQEIEDTIKQITQKNKQNKKE